MKALLSKWLGKVSVQRRQSLSFPTCLSCTNFQWINKFQKKMYY